MFGFSWFSENSEALVQKAADRKIDRAPEAGFADANVTHAWQGKSSQLPAVQIEREKVPKIFDTTKVVWLNLPLLVTDSSGFFVVESYFDLLENGVAQLFKQLNIGNRSSCAAKGDG